MNAPRGATTHLFPKSVLPTLAVVASLLMTLTPAAAMDGSSTVAGIRPVTIHVANGTQQIKARQYASWAFDVPSSKSGCLLTGDVTVLSGGEKDVMVLVMTGDQFANWQNDHQAQVFFSTGRETAIPLNVPMKGSGKYVLVVSNAFSLLTSKVVQTQAVQVHCGS